MRRIFIPFRPLRRAPAMYEHAAGRLSEVEDSMYTIRPDVARMVERRQPLRRAGPNREDKAFA